MFYNIFNNHFTGQESINHSIIEVVSFVTFSLEPALYRAD